MKIAILGTGAVGRSLASKFMAIGHEVALGTRNVNEKLKSDERDMFGSPTFGEWYNMNKKARLMDYGDATAFGEIIVNATKGGGSIEALKMAGERNLGEKILIDISNPLDFSKGMPPSLIPEYSNTNSLGEEIQKIFPKTRVVKTFNTMWNGLMVTPDLVSDGDHVNFISGNDKASKDEVKKLLIELGWKEENLLDIGDISAARATESYLLLWLRVMGTLQSGAFNIKIVR